MKNKNNILKCSFCPFITLRWKKGFNGFNALRKHVIDNHSTEWNSLCGYRLTGFTDYSELYDVYDPASDSIQIPSRIADIVNEWQQDPQGDNFLQEVEEDFEKPNETK